MVNVTQRSNSPRASALWIALTGFAGAAAAQTASTAADMTGVKVTYGDLNLANQVLLARIRQASRQACFAYELDYRDLQAIAKERLYENGRIFVLPARSTRARRDATTLAR